MSLSEIRVRGIIVVGEAQVHGVYWKQATMRGKAKHRHLFQ
jgi:hypothetical protein